MKSNGEIRPLYYDGRNVSAAFSGREDKQKRYVTKPKRITKFIQYPCFPFNFLNSEAGEHNLKQQ